MGGGRERFTESRWKDDRCGWSTGTRGRMVAVFDPDLGQDPYNHLESAHGAGCPKLRETHDFGRREARAILDLCLGLGALLLYTRPNGTSSSEYRNHVVVGRHVASLIRSFDPQRLRSIAPAVWRPGRSLQGRASRILMGRYRSNFSSASANSAVLVASYRASWARPLSKGTP